MWKENKKSKQKKPSFKERKTVEKLEDGFQQNAKAKAILSSPH